MYSPRREYLPLSLLPYRRYASGVVHSAPDHAIFVSPRQSRLVVTLHNYYLDAAYARMSSLHQRIHYRTDLRLFTRLAFKRAHAITAVSEFVAKLAQNDLGIDRDIQVIPNGIDVDAFRPQVEAHPGFRVLFCGNFVRRKGAHLLPSIAAGLAPGSEIWIASGLRDDTIVEVLPDNCKMIGKVAHADMPALYSQVDALLMPTLREGFGLAVAEAMACGLPVVGSRNSAIPELVVEGEGGFLADVEAPETFSEALNRLAADPTARQRMGSYNRRKAVRDYDERRMAETYLALFESLA